jgi:membrane protein
MSSLTRQAGDVFTQARALSPRDLVIQLVEAFMENKLLIWASAIAFRAAVAVIPLTLFALGLMGFLGLSELWTAELAPRLAAASSVSAFMVINDTVGKVLGQGQLFWMTIGAVVTVWAVSNTVRCTMHALNAVYETEEDRPFLEQFLVSVGLGLAAMVALLGAVACAQGLPALVKSVLGEGAVAAVLGFVIGWLAALCLLGLALGLMLRAGPDKSRPPAWVSFGAVLTVVLWVLASVLFGLYLTNLASYDSVFGALATAFVALEYLYLSSVVLLAGVQVDSIVREQIDS